MKVLFLPSQNPAGVDRVTLEAFRLASALAGFQGLVCENSEALLALSRSLTAKEEIHGLVCFLEDRECAQTLLAEHGFVHSVCALYQKAPTREERRDLQTGAIRTLLPVPSDLTSARPTLRESFLRVFARWQEPTSPALDEELPLARPLRFTVRTGEQRRSLLRAIEEDLGALAPHAQTRYTSSFLPRTLEVTDELLLNAFAVTGVSVEKEFCLPFEDAIEVECGFDGGVFAVSVRDRRGALRPWTLFRQIYGEVSEAPSYNEAGRLSFGLGLRTTFEVSSLLIAQVAPHRSTRMTALVPYERASADKSKPLPRVEYVST